ncbi:hypothetical protein [Stutzerimonas stutzeri]|uniref:Uncharacterized protein n=1 Tax=Stutzerimonas stutzeri KOS6 TaxID=1218352 RepID=A0A061JLQ6_STUST|nr:hypothetical protein [Stutzerimonas stutzeri]EWC39260.1 hypothetical protein B597_021220 [Stutzerimonas stutzeri KOS6]
MSFQAYPGLVIAPGLLLNGLALLCGLCGGWLLLATRWRQARAMARPVAAVNASTRDAVSVVSPASGRIDRVFYGFGAAGLLLGLGLSLASRLL